MSSWAEFGAPFEPNSVEGDLRLASMASQASGKHGFLLFLYLDTPWEKSTQRSRPKLHQSCFFYHGESRLWFCQLIQQDFCLGYEGVRAVQVLLAQRFFCFHQERPGLRGSRLLFRAQRALEVV